LRDEGKAVGLVEAIVEEAAEGFVVFGGEGGGDEGGAIKGMGGVGFGEGLGDEAAGLFGFDFEIGNEGDDF
jgi:hypothetical protein